MVDNLLEILKKTYVEFNFRAGKRFLFRFPKTIYFDPNDPEFDSLILHELGHAILGHSGYKTDVERLKMERAAWDEAEKIANSLKVKINKTLVEDDLDSYRNWLHQKSKCKKCGLTRYQTPDGKYHCPNCER